MWIVNLLKALLGLFQRAPTPAPEAPSKPLAGSVAPPPASPPPAPVPVQAPSKAPVDAFEAGFQFFMGPQYDGHLNDSAPSETFTTKYGVTQMTYAGALKEGVVTKPWAEVQTPDDVKPIYRRDFYDANSCGSMPACVAMVVFVDSTLMGDATPARNLQNLLKVSADGKIGAQTLAALAKVDPQVTATGLEMRDLAYLRTLKNWGLYKNGWTAREQNLLAAALKLA